MDIHDYVLGFIENYTSNLLNDDNQSIPTQAAFALHDTANKFRTNRTSGIALNVTFSLGRIDSGTYNNVERQTGYLSAQLPPLLTEPLSEIFVRSFLDSVTNVCQGKVNSWDRVYKALIMTSKLLLELHDSHSFSQRKYREYILKFDSHIKKYHIDIIFILYIIRYLEDRHRRRNYVKIPLFVLKK